MQVRIGTNKKSERERSKITCHGKIEKIRELFIYRYFAGPCLRKYI